MLNFLIWTVVLIVGGISLNIFYHYITYVMSTPEQKLVIDEMRAKAIADEEEKSRPLLDRMRQSGFQVTKVYEVSRRGIALDEDAKRLVLVDGREVELQTQLIPFSEVRGAEVDTVSSRKTVTKGGRSLTGALVGGAVLGPAGAVVGGLGGKKTAIEVETVRAVNLNVQVNSLDTPIISIEFLEKDWMGQALNTNIAITKANEWKALLNIIATR